MAIISQKKQEELEQMLEARSGAGSIRRLAPGQMAFWPEERRAFANELTRSALWHCRDARKPRLTYDNAPLFVLGEGEMTYTGEELREKEEEIFAALAHCARELPSGNLVVNVTSSQLCKLNGWRQGQYYYTEIFRSIQRLKGGIITVYSKRLTMALKCQKALEGNVSEAELSRLYKELKEFERLAALDLPLPGEAGQGLISGMMVSLISGNPVFTGAKAVIDGIPQGNLTWEIPLDKNLVSLFARPYLTYVDYEARQKLTMTGRRLQAYFCSHAKPHPVTLKSLAKMLHLEFKNMEKDQSQLKVFIKGELQSLQDEGIIHEFQFSRTAGDDGWKVTVIREKPEAPAQND